VTIRVRGFRPLLPLLAAMLFATACIGATDDGTAGVPLLGSWEYTGTQLSPELQLQGSLVVSRQAGSRFDGSVDVVEQSPSGGMPRRLIGVLGGRTLDSVTVDFDVVVDNTTRRHFGTVRGDSIVGSWVEGIGGGASGSFRAKLVTP
jgi:hypothetical protein